MYDSCMAVMTVSEARATLPEVLTRVAAGEEITITRYGSPIAVVVRKRHGRSLEQELRAILDAAGSDPEPAPLPPIRLATVRTAASSSWSREEIYGDEGR
jgi:prevent-host-death family protein